jgi:cytochrome d ubiquinol oxidase subunit I
MALPFIAVIAVAQVLVGHEHGENVHEHQPAKVAAMEGAWETRTHAPLLLFAIPDQAAARNRLEVALPGLASLVVTGSLDGELEGLKEWPADERPPVAWVFWSFRLMVGLGILMLVLGLYGVRLLRRGAVASSRRFLRLCQVMGPTGFVAVIAGWTVAEVGRQPWTVHGLVRTVDSTSPVTASAVGTSLIVYAFVYFTVFGAGVWYMLRQAAKDPDSGGDRVARPAHAAFLSRDLADDGGT